MQDLGPLFISERICIGDEQGLVFNVHHFDLEERIKMIQEIRDENIKNN